MSDTDVERPDDTATADTPLTPEVVTQRGGIQRMGRTLVAQYVAEGRHEVSTMTEGEIQLRIVAAALEAGDVGGLLAPNAVEKADAVLNQPLEISDYDLNDSPHEGLGYYAVFSALVLNEERHTTIQCGAPEVVLKLQHAKAMGWLPMQAKLVELNESKDGRNPALGLVALDAFDIADPDDDKPESARDKG